MEASVTIWSTVSIADVFLALPVPRVRTLRVLTVLRLSMNPKLGLAYENMGPREESVDIDFCDPNPCQNKAPCYNVGGDYYCACSDDYDGKNCSHLKDHCKNGLCKDSCTIAISTNATQDDIRYISSNVCGPHGRCISLPGGNFTCSCNRGFTGAYCHENINDCHGNPCRNGGTCTDEIDSFKCFCPSGWGGEFCDINYNDCNPNPCQNGGRCLDLVNDFVCQCENGWKGKTCHSREYQCDANTCSNGGTCYDTGDSFRCLCSSGWEGATCNIGYRVCLITCFILSFICQHILTHLGWEIAGGYEKEAYTNDCNPYPWEHIIIFTNCSYTGYALNIDECQSSPCAYGATCIDEINGYRCTCPSGRAGPRCQEVIGFGRSCWLKGVQYPHGSKWDEECNSCHCLDGVIDCTQVWCGKKPCLLERLHDKSQCPQDRECEPTRSSVKCFQPPCRDWGECSAPDRSHMIKCLPNSGYLDNNCARITLIFNPEKIPQGTTVENICSEIRYLPSIRTVSEDQPLVILCDETIAAEKAVEVTVGHIHLGTRFIYKEEEAISREQRRRNKRKAAPDSGEQLLLLQALVSQVDNQDASLIQNAANTIVNAITKRQNSTVMLAVTEVKVETTVVDGSSSDYLVPVLCVVFGIVWMTCISICVWWTRKRRKERERRREARQEEEANNQRQPLNPIRNPIRVPYRDIQYECKNLLHIQKRTSGEEEGVKEDMVDKEEDTEEDDCLPQSYTKAYTSIGDSDCSKSKPHRTSLDKVDNRCVKNVNTPH
ncbi:unnamed protein product [Ranitomeya imitator]|uniref:EGF-like domain-containing protein n=1 Tax=Ranitomeya imitator TaxID=111125 RepID=A0ABN9M261_9NEOB|nr:unnamed protein product [Ranitomeya imitator]